MYNLNSDFGSNMAQSMLNLSFLECNDLNLAAIITAPCSRQLAEQQQQLKHLQRGYESNRSLLEVHQAQHHQVELQTVPPANYGQQQLQQQQQRFVGESGADFHFVGKYSKRVHFGECSLVGIPTVEEYREADLIDDIWWNSETIAQNRIFNRMEVESRSIIEDEEYQKSISFLMKSFKPENYNRSRHTLIQHVKTVMKANTRGLEQRRFPKLKAYRKRASQSVLALQQKLKENKNTSSLKPDLVATMLRHKSLKTSRGSRQLAFRLAQADRLEANAIYKHEKEASASTSSSDDGVEGTVVG